jgi:hypothetical protein
MSRKQPLSSGLAWHWLCRRDSPKEASRICSAGWQQHVDSYIFETCMLNCLNTGKMLVWASS